MRYLQILFFGLALVGGYAQAESKLYAEADYMRSTVKAGGAKFTPYQGKFKLGYYIQNKVALEGQYILSGDDNDSGSNLEITKLYGAYLRLDSNLHNRVRLYLLAGYAETQLKVKGNLESLTSEKDGDFSYGIGAEDQMARMRNTFFTLEYMQYYKKEPFDISGISLGFRYLF